MIDDYGKVQGCCDAPLLGPHPITSSVSYLLTLYGDIHGSMSYLLTPYSDIHTRQLLPVYTRIQLYPVMSFIIRNNTIHSDIFGSYYSSRQPRWSSACASCFLNICKGNSQIPTFQLCDSCDTLQFLQFCAIVHLKSRTKSQHPFITQYMSHIVYPYHVVPLSVSVPRYCHPIPSPSCFTYYFQYFLYFIFSPYLSSVIHCWLLCTLFLM